jgi:ribosome-associated toxin RatA of RatAB toxin-antitoxin module
LIDDHDVPSCNVNFEVEIQLSNPFIAFTLDRVLKDVANAQVEAFEKRCRAIAFDNESKTL